jgi:hypothetical protein
MSNGGEIASATRRQVVEGFVNWLYDESPIWLDEVPRERLLALWADAHEARDPRVTTGPGDGREGRE